MTPVQFSRKDLDRAIEAYKRGCGCGVFSLTDVDSTPIYTSNGVEIENARHKLKDSKVAPLKELILALSNYYYGNNYEPIDDRDT